MTAQPPRREARRGVDVAQQVRPLVDALRGSRQKGRQTPARMLASFLQVDAVVLAELEVGGRSHLSVYGAPPRFSAEASRKLARPISLAELRTVKGLEKMTLLQKGSRLSVQSVTDEEWKIIYRLGTTA